VRGEAGSQVLVDHSEVLGPKRAFDNRNYRCAKAQTLYTLAGSGEEVYAPTFTFQGYRYARVTITGPAEILAISRTGTHKILTPPSSAFFSNGPSSCS
jgi:alpha-L-rhamnosidase